MLKRPKGDHAQMELVEMVIFAQSLQFHYCRLSFSSSSVEPPLKNARNCLSKGNGWVPFFPNS